MSGDEWFRHRALAPRSDWQRRLAADVRWLGDGAVVLPVLAAGYGAARLAHRDAAAASVARAGISTVAAGVVALALKRAIGRSRPSETPDDPHRFDPFSSHDAMPSGHTTIAFALARAVDRECDARWVPWVAYPAAALVGWSRVHDDDHWASDVVAGAAVGLWTASKAEIVLRREAGRGHRIGLRLAPGRAGIALTLGAAP
ncbi:MAG: phosphatase PAP2 family protein [Candidatus Eisenbacteria bacterium]|nr:phosphatase PAP2 family protein [Candidatus Eisenbacteria bacterium]